MVRTVPVLLLVTALAMPAAASHKPPIHESYEVTAPVPFPFDGEAHCADGVEGTTKNTRPVTLPDRGVLVVELSGFVGDWVLELFNEKGKVLAQSAKFEPANTAPKREVTYTKATRGQKVRIAVCNFRGSPKAKVAYTFTFR